jgi:hypothetical protein
LGELLFRELGDVEFVDLVVDHFEIEVAVAWFNDVAFFIWGSDVPHVMNMDKI